MPPLWRRRRNIAIPFGVEKLEWWGYKTVKNLWGYVTVYTQYRRVTDRQTSCNVIVRGMHTRLAVKKIAIFRTVCEIHRYIGRKRPFLPRDAMHSAEYAIAGYLSVCLSVCLSDAGILSNWLNISLNIFHHRVTTLFYFFRTKRYKNISTGGTKNRIFDRNLSVCRK